MKIKMTIVYACALANLAHAATTCDTNRTCLEIMMTDASHDGWEGAMFYLETPWDEIYADAPTSERDPAFQFFCTERSGLYPTVVDTEENTIPSNFWEIRWTVIIVNPCNTTGNATQGGVVTGGFNTSMIWGYDADSDEWTLVFAENLWHNASAAPTTFPSTTPTHRPSGIPTGRPTFNPVLPRIPSLAPTVRAPNTPTKFPTTLPSFFPSTSFRPTQTSSPSSHPTLRPTSPPSSTPTRSPSSHPSNAPSLLPTVTPSFPPTGIPTFSPSSAPTFAPSSYPTAPTPAPIPNSPTWRPTLNPTHCPTSRPTASPSTRPTIAPTKKSGGSARFNSVDTAPPHIPVPNAPLQPTPKPALSLFLRAADPQPFSQDHGVGRNQITRLPHIRRRRSTAPGK
jgi:hypothetical protein